MSRTIPRSAGRSVFGADGNAYAAYRPDYPERVNELLRASGAITPSAIVFEIGPGTGQATERLLGMAESVTAIEADDRFVPILEQRLQDAPGLQIIRNTFEDAELPDAAYDLGIAATSFHWLEPDSALAKIHRILRPGGWWAMWWTVFGDPDAVDPFQQRTHHLFEKLNNSPSHPEGSRLPFALDTAQRSAELARAGFTDVIVETIRWSPILTTQQVVGLTATFSPVAILEDGARNRFLTEIGEIAEAEFSGQVQRNFVTPVYLARKPE